MAYALTTLAIISLTVMAVGRMGVDTAAAKRMADTRDEVVAQASLIRTKLIACVVNYPAGDPTTNDPIQTTSAIGQPISSVRCPGNPAANKIIWTGTDGVYSPRQLRGLSLWKFIHTAGGTASTITITTTDSDNAISAALNNAALRFGAQGHRTATGLVIDITN